MEQQQPKKKGKKKQENLGENLNTPIEITNLSSKQEESLISPIVEVPTEHSVKEQSKKQKIKKPKELSFQAKKWEAYFKKIGITPEQYLKRYPLDQNKQYIEEIINLKNS